MTESYIHNITAQAKMNFDRIYKTGVLIVNCKERITCTNSSEVKPDLCEDQDQQCSIKYKSKRKPVRTAKVNFNAKYFG